MTEQAIEHCWLETPLGDMYLAIRDGALCEAAFIEHWAQPAPTPQTDHDARDLSPAANAIRNAVNAYFNGEVAALDAIPIDPAGSDFQRDVWQAIRDVPAGQTASYQAIAQAIGRPAAYRAVGTATGRNPVGIAVPCHRIVRSDGGLGGYGGGLHRKQWFLDHERQHINHQPQPENGSSL